MSKPFKPGPGLTIAVFIGLAILLGLGTWQARKVGPKTALLAKIEAGMTGEAMPLPVHLDDPSVLDYHRVTFRGQLMDAEPIRVFATSLDGKAGYHLYMPVKKQHGMAVLVNFGWIPVQMQENPGLPVGATLEVTGVLRTTAVPGDMTPANDPQAGDWYTADVFAMAEAFGLRTKEFYHFRVFADADVLATSLPKGGQVRVDIPNNHFQYAMTWFGIALALVGVYLVFGFKRGAEGNSPNSA
ncbi:SURF1 family protein [Kordiimonas aestuarii]|uniref:SURF1 family protein n=1 Tax=Kordiimonas aestuarii TaxID=1005925 RepID=UPI0021D2E632|nr:SURF1 family cytochrome oxidase biogenesis protein [Kordiimonas aestuarii]